ncbi:hypothetical protein [Halorussus ruber]|uniref:hypothetical protein n=1 Tax=Halorussus ruber TaxID=1126238 RepID=UPI00143D97F7|nr:hypothetical protein [Halorussus ruber]
MRDNLSNRFNRRNVLQMSALGLASFSGVSATTAAANHQPSQAEDHWVSEAKQNVPEFAAKGQIGAAKGGFNTPVTEATIDKLYSKVIGDNVSSDRLALPKPTRDEDVHGTPNSVFGVVVSVTGDAVDISVQREPAGLESPSPELRKQAEARAHQKVDHKVKEAKDNAATGNGGGN